MLLLLTSRREGGINQKDKPMSESPDSQPADGSIVDYRRGDGTVRHLPEVNCHSRLNHLNAAWVMSKAMVAIAILDGPLLRPLFAPLLEKLEATLCDAVGCHRDMSEIEPPQDETPQAFLDMESDLIFTRKLISALESFPVSSEARFSSLGVPLLHELRATLCFILDATDDQDAPLHGNPAATNDCTPGVPDRLLDLVTLDQAAGSVCRQKRTLEHYKRRGELPAPTVKGRGGKPDLWEWKVMRSWLTKTFSIDLPEQFPANSR